MRWVVVGKLLGAVVVAGVLVAAVAGPWLVGLDLAGRAAADSQGPVSSNAVEEVTTAPLPGITQVLAADGSLIADFYDQDRVPVTAAQIAPVMGTALVDIEDSRFYSHGGVDPIGTLRALVTDVSSGGAAQGGSTITQQLVKQTLLQRATTSQGQQEATADTLARKLTEARLALAVDARLSKADVLTRYLNTVYFGHGAYGVQAAARTYFSVDASALTPLQAATLAGLVQNPSADDPIAHPDVAQARRDVVLHRMHDLGDLSDADLATDLATPVTTVPGGTPPQGCAQALVGGFFCSYVRGYLTGTLGLTDQQLDDGGLTIQTTLEPGVQRAGDAAVVRTVPQDSPLAAVYDVVQPGTGHVLAMSVNRTYGCTGTGCTSVDLPTAAARGSGSTYKLFTAAYALQHGYTASFTQTTSDPYTSTVYKKNGGTRGAPYVVQNAGHYPETLDLADALVESSNTFFVGLEDHLGSVAGPVREAQKLGLASLTDQDAQQVIDGEEGSFTLGPLATSPLDLADAYATVFSGGTQCDPTPVTAVLAADGSPMTGADGAALDTGDHCTAGALPAPVAHTLAQVMRGDVQSDIGTASRARIAGHDIAGKTGTTQGNVSVAFVGSTPEYTASVLVFNPDENVDVGGFGGGKSAQIWHDAMAPVLAAGPTAAFPAADRQVLGVPAGGDCPFTEGNLTLVC
ncbi:transglycosylase domain-containing protein [Klenkia sp. PcliD-1-E]|uniref:transglycosylase domain-containing protein n=1 Tax=Klenkia sp. PcliD-1-E TaxID=2954492 RepID=UPI002096828B|nr:transglycosylase domain-containing protein [Klenkia sp. PcliD-1-E]MCO7219614.1 penicillin-binding protein [Klenkia sp. PcliD-1-E]